MRKCRNCLCRTCIKSCKCHNCKGKIEQCRNYSRWRQLSVFDIPTNSAPRESWGYYGLEDKQYRNKLMEMAKLRKYLDITVEAANRTDKDIAKYIIKAVTKGKSWDYLEHDFELGRIIVGRSDFYGYLHKFYYFFNEELKENGINVD